MKGNLMVRLMTGLILIGIALAQFSGQTDLMSANWLWLAVLPALMGFQATFTGWCPAELIGKLSKSGECCPGGSCGTAPAPQQATPKSESNIDGSADKNACCGDEDAPKSSECCSDATLTNTGCCGGDSEKSPGLVVQVLGTGCKTCHNTVTRIEDTARKMGVQVSVQKVEDVAEIASFGVTATPGVVIGDTVVHSGGMPSVTQIEQWLADTPAKPETAPSDKAGA